jgi:hypothetical protein
VRTNLFTPPGSLIQQTTKNINSHPTSCVN